ncbi:MAG: SDR family oxidoreductase [Actinomycetia bacterium]|nr:SDR family oxidoreductase [Actinomycetes bacterium]
MTVALITGANSGLGRGAAVELAKKGWTVYGSMRSLDKGEKVAAMAAEAGVTVHPVVCDVTDTASVNAAVDEVTNVAGRIDVLVNNAGVGGNGVVEESSIEHYQAVMDVNLYGTIRCVQAVAPQMRERGDGCIINISSVAGLIAAISQSPYVASKWAVEGLSEGLAHELAPFGIRVAVIEPGIIKTAILAKNTDAPNATGAYAAHYRRLFAFYAAGLRDPGRPEEVAEVIYAAATDESPQFRYTCGWGGPELSSRKPGVADRDWIDMGALTDDADYAARFQQLFGLDLSGALIGE